MLKLIENSFTQNENKVKLQLLLLPIFCIYFYFYIFDNDINLSSAKSSSLKNLLSKKFNGSYLDLTKELESFCLLKKIKVISVDYHKDNLFIKGKTSLKKINKLIIKIESINNFSKINSLTIEKNDKANLYTFEIRTEFKKFYIKNKITGLKHPA